MALAASPARLFGDQRAREVERPEHDEEDVDRGEIQREQDERAPADLSDADGHRVRHGQLAVPGVVGGHP